MLGIVILALSGLGWLLIGYGFSALLIVKIALVVGIFVLGPIIDNAVEPKFRSLAPANGEAPPPEFLKTYRQLVGLEMTAASLFDVIFALGVSL